MAKAVKKASEPVATEGQPQAPQRMFLISEQAVQSLFATFQELPYRVADPVIKFLQAQLQEHSCEKIENKEG